MSRLPATVQTPRLILRRPELADVTPLNRAIHLSHAELKIWMEASKEGAHTPIPEMAEDPDFRSYQSFEEHWGRELNQLKRQASTDGDVRFYYTGMAQAVLLDHLMPDWKTRIFEPGIFLDDLLATAVEK